MVSSGAVLIVLIVFVFTFLIVEKALKHAENIERIKHGYPLKDGTRKKASEEYDNFQHETRLQ